MLWTQLCFLWNPALHAKTPDCVPWDPPARRAPSRHPDPCPQHSLSNPPPPNGMNTGFLNGVAQGDFRARGRRPPCRWGLRGAVQGQPGSSRGLQEDTGLHTRRVPTRGGGRARSTQARTVSTSRTLFERDGWLPSQAKPAGDTPAPRVGALTLLLLLQHLVPEVLVRGAAAGPLPLGKQIWECEGLPVCQLHVGHLIVWLLYPDVPVIPPPVGTCRKRERQKPSLPASSSQPTTPGTRFLERGTHVGTHF